MRRPTLRPHLQIASLVVCALSLLAASAAQAATLLDVGPGGTEAATTVVGPLPTWLQVATPTAPLYTADSGGNQVAPNVPKYTFLRVLSGGTTRLQVDAYDESGNISIHGWIDPGQTLPSAPGIGWLVASTPTPLWRSADAGADAVRQLDRFTPLLLLDGPVQDRIHVWTYRSDFSGSLDQGWVDVADTGTALAPQMRVPSPGDRTFSMRVTNATNQQQAFLDLAAHAARDGAVLTGVPASVTVAQAILESDWGRSQLAQSANNYFGIKATGSLGPDGVVWMPTSEYDGAGQLYQTVSAFRAYQSLTDSMTDHDRLLGTSSRYAAAMNAAQDPKQFASLLAEAGYSTDPAYADKIIALMDRYNLYQLDA
jgi:Mannosyl-glycoprotein endo-beta-N-acetylglucosaminidase